MKVLQNKIKKAVYQEAEIIHLRNLIWSNLSDNDLLALEIVRNRGLPKILLPEYTAVALTAKTKLVKTAYWEYLESTLEVFKSATIKKLDFRYFSNIDFQTLRYVVDIDQLIYTYYKRTGDGISEFLLHGSTNTLLRREMFELYLEALVKSIRKHQAGRYLNVKGLTESELKELLEEETIAKIPWQSIFIESPTIQIVPKALYNFQSLSRLSIVNAPLLTFPEEIFQLSNLYTLTISGVTFDRPPKDWSGLKEIVNLDFTDSKFTIDDFSFVSTMPKLKSLQLGNSVLTDPYLIISKKTSPLENWAGFELSFRYPFKSMLALASALERSSLSTADKHFFFDTIRQIDKIKDLPKLSIINLLKALTINHPPLRQLCLERLEEHATKMDSMGTLKKGAVVKVIGNTVMKKTDIKAKLKAVGIEYAAKFTKKVSHVIIGKNPKDIIDSANLHLKILSENQLQKFFSSNLPNYLEQAVQEGQTTIQENISALLTSTDSNNVLIAIEMLQSGGVPPNILEDLLVAQKTNADSKVRAAAKKLLELYAPVDWLPLIQDKQHFAMIHKEVREQDINNKLHKVAKNTSRKLAAMLSLAIFKIHRRGLRYVLYHFHTPHPIRTQAFQAMMNGTHFDYSAGIGFKNLRERTPDTLTLFKMKLAATFPVDILDVITPIESIDFHNCKYDKLHQGIGKFVDLKHLHCSCNLINKLPRTFKKLQKLETLDLSNNTFKEFPMQVLHLPNLKKLDLRFMHNRQLGGFYQLEIPKEMKTKLPNCEVLV